MGCVHSKKELREINPNIFRVVNVDDDGVDLWTGELAISRTELTLYRKHKEPTQWPLKCLRRYGYDADLFTFEAGRRCTTGEGIYAFRCNRAEILFQTLQNFIQLPIEENQMDMFPIPSATNGPAVTPRNRTSTQSSLSNGGISGSNYVTNRPISQNLSPSGTIQSNSNRSRSIDTLTGEGNYLEPTPSRPTAISRFHSGLRLGSVGSGSGGASGAGGPLSPDLHSPGSPNSINNILEVTTLNPLPVGNPGISNLYQEFPLREHNNNIHLHGSNHQKKLSLDIPPQEPAPSLNLSTTRKTQSAVITNNELLSSAERQRMLAAATSNIPGPLSPNSSMLNSESFDSSHMYMNITLADIQKSSTVTSGVSTGCDTPQVVQTPTTTQHNMFGTTRLNSTFSIDPNRVYENLESAEIRPLLTRATRYSKPDIFAKMDVPNAALPDKSEPCTPNMHYIVLDLDQSPSSNRNGGGAGAEHNNSLSLLSTNAPTSNFPTSVHTITTTPVSNSPTTSTANTPSMVVMSALPPESPKKGVMDYATIDFNKTVALSNSTMPSSDLDSEGSRKTRHSSVAVLSSSTVASCGTKNSIVNND